MTNIQPSNSKQNTLASNLSLFKRSSVTDQQVWFWEARTDHRTSSLCQQRNYFTNSKNKIRQNVILSYPSLCYKLISRTIRSADDTISCVVHSQKHKTMQQKWLDESQMPFAQHKETNSRSHSMQDKDHLKRNVTEMSNTSADPLLVISHI